MIVEAICIQHIIFLSVLLHYTDYY